MRSLRAFIWLRWRVLMNSLERSGARDRVERFSRAIEQLGPIMAAVLMIPSAILLAGAGGYGGWALAQGHARPLPFEALRVLLLLACGLTIIGPFLIPAGERTNAVRLLLLPISRVMLYAAQAATTLADPWVFLVVPVVAAIPVGLAIGGAWGNSLIAATAGVLLVLVLTGIGSLASSLIHMVVRNRRRGELLTLVFILIIPLAGVLPGVLTDRERLTDLDRRNQRAPARPAWLTTFEQRVMPLVPSEMYVDATRAAAGTTRMDVVRPLAGLAVTAGLLHVAGLLVFGRLLDSPGSATSRSRMSRRKARAWRLPGLSPGTSAVAQAHIRLALRTPRGRSILLSPLVVFLMFGAMMWRGGAGVELGLIQLHGGLTLAIFGAFVSLLAILPMAMNQFAIDGAGLTLAFLSPLDDRELLRGKAIGNGVIAAVPALLCIAGAAALFPGGGFALWISVPLGVAAAYLLVAPAAAGLSALFPRKVDLNSVGRGSNAHGAAGFLGLLAFIAAGAPGLLLALFATRVLDRPYLTPFLMVMWCVVCAALARVLFLPVGAVLRRRRENLALMR